MASVTSVTIEDNSKEVLAEEERAIMAVLVAIGGQAELYAKQDCPVDTGRLRNSITFATQTTHSDGNTNKDPDGPADAFPEDYELHGEPEIGEVYIGTNVEYAPQVELLDRSHRTGKAHFLRDAASTHGDEYRKIAEDIFKAN